MNALSPMVGHELVGVRYGTLSCGKVHLALRPIREPGEIGRSSDSDALCGRENSGLSVCCFEFGVLREVGWTDGKHLCRQCLAEAQLSEI